jgi:CBS domain-containing protein
VNPKQAKASVVMTPEPATVSADEDASVVALRMMRLGIRHLPVVDAEGRPVGLVSARNLVAVLDRAKS